VRLLSYRHAFHAGNHADVLKHVILVALLRYLTQKPKPLWYVETHAGAGVYPLSTGFATRNREYEDGIARLWCANDPPPAIEPYMSLVRALNPDGTLVQYPGSPWLAARMLRPDDRIWLHELHPADRQTLTDFCGDRRTQIRAEDGLAALRGLLPPEPRRALVLIDPSYEVKSDYETVLSALRDAVDRFTGGTYVVWYPLLSNGQSESMAKKMLRLGVPRWLHARLIVRSHRVPGMYGSGVFVINPAYTLPEQLGELLPFLQTILAQDADAGHSLHWEIP